MKNYNIKNNQSGAALVVGLVLLVVVTVLAVSGMNTATTELAMARNDQNYENAFQAAESGLDQALSMQPFNTAVNVNLVQDINANDTVTITVQYEDSSVAPADSAYSWGSGISALHFLATSTSQSKRAGVAGAVTDRDATAIHSQAFYTIGPEFNPL
ncbi:MAG: type IV pilus assembly protein PilX [Woeseiaceae bacterium]|jgi:type IV pilus assembly protein PilX